MGAAAGRPAGHDRRGRDPGTVSRRAPGSRLLQAGHPCREGRAAAEAAEQDSAGPFGVCRGSGEGGARDRSRLRAGRASLPDADGKRPVDARRVPRLAFPGSGRDDQAQRHDCHGPARRAQRHGSRHRRRRRLQGAGNAGLTAFGRGRLRAFGRPRVWRSRVRPRRPHPRRDRPRIGHQRRERPPRAGSAREPEGSRGATRRPYLRGDPPVGLFSVLAAILRPHRHVSPAAGGFPAGRPGGKAARRRVSRRRAWRVHRNGLGAGEAGHVFMVRRRPLAALAAVEPLRQPDRKPRCRRNPRAGTADRDQRRD